MKVAVYTSVIPMNFDSFKIQPEQTIPTDFIRYGPTYPLPEDIKGLHPRMQAKYFKFLPEKIPKLFEYDYTIWIDGSAQILSEKFVEEMIGRMEGSFMVFKHPEARDCIYQEAEYCKTMPKYVDQRIEAQANFYRSQGYPEHNGLYACGMIVRKNREFANRLLGKLWWDECREWTYQDQLSLPYVLWKANLKIDILNLDQYNNGLITFERTHATIL